jgi:geranylgeranyl diphosphate synthase type I
MVRTRKTTKPSALELNAAEPFLRFLAAHKQRFDDCLRRQLRRDQKRFPRSGDAVKTTTQALIELCERGGKRVRPTFVLIGNLCVQSRPNLDAVAQAGAALELLHAYFLVHDDWMDGDLVRRGGPSVHAQLRERFGSPSLGDAAAILAGDWGAAVSTDWIARLPIPKERLASTLACFVEMQLTAIVGQVRDILADDDRPELTYELKTASYTVSGPLQLGALLGGASPSTLETLHRFALPIGVAFQLKDDLIGVFSPESVTGKPFASDLKQGKRTVLLREAARRAGTAEQRLMKRVVGHPDAPEKALVRLVRFFEESGAKTAVEKRISTLHNKALTVLETSKFRTEGKTLLRSAATALIERGS